MKNMRKRIEIYVLSGVALIGAGALALECAAAYPVVRFHCFARAYTDGLAALVAPSKR